MIAGQYSGTSQDRWLSDLGPARLRTGQVPVGGAVAAIGRRSLGGTGRTQVPLWFGPRSTWPGVGHPGGLRRERAVIGCAEDLRRHVSPP